MTHERAPNIAGPLHKGYCCTIGQSVMELCNQCKALDEQRERKRQRVSKDIKVLADSVCNWMVHYQNRNSKNGEAILKILEHKEKALNRAHDCYRVPNGMHFQHVLADLCRECFVVLGRGLVLGETFGGFMGGMSCTM